MSAGAGALAGVAVPDVTHYVVPHSWPVIFALLQFECFCSSRVAHSWWVVVFLHEVEAEGLVVWYVQVIPVCEVSVIFPAVSESDFLVVLGGLP